MTLLGFGPAERLYAILMHGGSPPPPTPHDLLTYLLLPIHTVANSKTLLTKVDLKTCLDFQTWVKINRNKN